MQISERSYNIWIGWRHAVLMYLFQIGFPNKFLISSATNVWDPSLSDPPSNSFDIPPQPHGCFFWSQQSLRHLAATQIARSVLYLCRGGIGRFGTICGDSLSIMR